MKVVSIINYKGGVGKTTITSNLAAGLATKGYKVLAIDLDPQSNLTLSFIQIKNFEKNYAEKKTIRNWFKEDTKTKKFKNLIVKPEKLDNENLNLICSHIGLINTDIELATRMNGATNESQKSNYINTHSILKKGLQEIEKENYDIVLIDCPPSFNIVTRNALVASDYYMVPIKLDYLSTLGLDELNAHIEELRRDYNSNIEDKDEYMKSKLIGVVCNMVSKKLDGVISEEDTYIKKVRSSNYMMFRSMLRENKTIHASSPKDGIPAILKKVNGITHKYVKQELEELVDEFIEKVGL